jgi:sugar O-acyltransferase (sialic acid O-acetyltransferase NeuD family)
VDDPALVQQIAVLGAGGTGLLIADSISRTHGKRVMGFLDDDKAKKGLARGDFTVLGGLSSWEDLPDDCLFVSSLYGPKKNADYFDRIKSLGIPETRWAAVVDPTAIVLSHATWGYGSYIGPATVLEPNVSLGNWCAMLGRVYIAHDTRMDDYTVCANSASIAGGVSVGSATFIGANAIVREHIRIGNNALVGMGSVVIRDVPDNSVVVGNPCREI